MDDTPPKIRKEGWVRKQSRWWKEYRFRYAVLAGTELSTYKKKNCKEETENIDVTQCNAVYDLNKANQFILEGKTSPTLKFLLICKSDQDCNEWLKQIYIAQQSVEKEVELRPLSGSDHDHESDSHIYDLVLQSISDLDEPMHIGFHITPEDVVTDEDDNLGQNEQQDMKDACLSLHEDDDDISTSMLICGRCQHLFTYCDTDRGDDHGLSCSSLCPQCAADDDNCKAVTANDSNQDEHAQDSKANERNELNEVALWLTQDMQMPQYVGMFMEHGFDAMQIIIRNMSDSTLVDIGVQCIEHRGEIMDDIRDRRRTKNVIPNTSGYVLDVEQCKQLQQDFEHYQKDCSTSLPELAMFAPVEALVVRHWRCLKTEYYQRVLDDHLHDSDSDTEHYRFLHQLLFETIVSCDAVLRDIYERVRNEYMYGRAIDLVLLNIDILHKHTRKAKNFNRFQNIAMFIKRQIVDTIVQKLDEKFQNAQDDYFIEFMMQCCQLLWPVIGYGYELSPVQFTMECEYDPSVHTLHDPHGNETSTTLFCVFPALYKENVLKTKMWVICERE